MAKINFNYFDEPASMEVFGGEDKISFNLRGKSFYITSKSFGKIMVMSPGLFHKGEITFLTSNSALVNITFEGVSFPMCFNEIPRSAGKDYKEVVNTLRRNGYKVVLG